MEAFIVIVLLILPRLLKHAGPFVLALLPLISDRCNERYRRMKEAEHSSSEQR